MREDIRTKLNVFTTKASVGGIITQLEQTMALVALSCNIFGCELENDQSL